jgi:hypothetical protein
MPTLSPLRRPLPPAEMGWWEMCSERRPGKLIAPGKVEGEGAVMILRILEASPAGKSQRVGRLNFVGW